MHKDNFYHIIDTQQQENIILATLQLIYDHPIYAGHFPGQPVLPGACILNMVQEVLCIAIQSRCQLKKANSLKFLTPVNPDIVRKLKLKLIYKSVNSGLQLIVSLSANEVICFKMQGIYIELI